MQSSEEDRKAVLPYIRDSRFVNHKLAKTKKVFRNSAGQDQKVELLNYSGSENEDAEHFVEAFEHFIKTMNMLGLWPERETDRNTQVPSLFNTFGEVLTGNATQDWYEIIGGPTPTETTWMDFKNKVLLFCIKKVFSKVNPYQTQVDYMMKRPKPSTLKFREWVKRLKTLNRMLPYMLDRPTLERVTSGRLKAYKDVWHEGAFSQAQLIHIILTHSPKGWVREFESAGLSEAKVDLEELEEYMEGAESREIAKNREQQLRRRQPVEFRGGARRAYNGRFPRVMPSNYVRSTTPQYYQQYHYQQNQAFPDRVMSSTMTAGRSWSPRAPGRSQGWTQGQSQGRMQGRSQVGRYQGRGYQGRGQQTGYGGNQLHHTEEEKETVEAEADAWQQDMFNYLPEIETTQQNTTELHGRDGEGDEEWNFWLEREQQEHLEQTGFTTDDYYYADEEEQDQYYETEEYEEEEYDPRSASQRF
jgi:hypothetical protein